MWILGTAHNTFHDIHCNLHPACCALHTAQIIRHCTGGVALIKVKVPHCTVQTPHNSLHSAHLILQNLRDPHIKVKDAHSTQSTHCTMYTLLDFVQASCRRSCVYKSEGCCTSAALAQASTLLSLANHLLLELDSNDFTLDSKSLLST